MGVTSSTGYTLCGDCGGYYLVEESHRGSARHRQWLKSQATGQVEVPVPVQPPPAIYEEMPKRIVFGETVICPECRGQMPRVKKGDKPDPKKMFTRRKGHPQEPCPRCDGLGYIPSRGA